jgi:hypothetical protein
MAGTIVADNIQAASTSTLVLKNGVANTPPTIQDSGGTEIGTFCRAWVNFNGTSTVAIRASFNVSSITDNGTGIYTANFTNALPDANYSTVVAAQKFDTTNNGDTIATLGATNQAYSTTAVNFVVRTVNSDTRVDSPIICVAVFR